MSGPRGRDHPTIGRYGGLHLSASHRSLSVFVKHQHLLTFEIYHPKNPAEKRQLQVEVVHVPPSEVELRALVERTIGIEVPKYIQSEAAKRNPNPIPSLDEQQWNEVSKNPATIVELLSRSEFQISPLKCVLIVADTLLMIYLG